MPTLLDLHKRFFLNADCKRAPEQDRIILVVPKDSPLNNLIAESGEFTQIHPPEKKWCDKPIFPIDEYE